VPAGAPVCGGACEVGPPITWAVGGGVLGCVVVGRGAGATVATCCGGVVVVGRCACVVTVGLGTAATAGRDRLW
jgi:hypothetical protein